MENILLPIAPIPITPDSLEPPDATPSVGDFAEVLARCVQTKESKAEPLEREGDNSGANISFLPWASLVPVTVSDGDPIAANTPSESPLAPVPESGSSLPLIPLSSSTQSMAQNPESNLNPFLAQPIFDSEDMESGSPHPLAGMENDFVKNPISSPGENVLSSFSLPENLIPSQPQNTQDSQALNVQNFLEKMTKPQAVEKNIPIVQEKETKPGKSSSSGQEAGKGDSFPWLPLEGENKGVGVLQREFPPPLRRQRLFSGSKPGKPCPAWISRPD